MRFYYDHNDYGGLFVRSYDKVYCFDLNELIEEILNSGESVEEYCSLAEWEFGNPLFDLNNDEHSKEFADVIEDENVHEITYHQMINIIKNCVTTYILESKTDYTIKEVSEILGQGVIDHLTDILWDNLKEFTFIK